MSPRTRAATLRSLTLIDILLRRAYVPAAAVKPAPQVVGMIIGPKAFVAGPASSWSNPPAQRVGC